MFSRYPNRINQVTPKKGTPFTTTKNRRKKGRIDNIRTKAGRASLLHFCFWRGKFTVGSWCYSSEDKKQNTIYCKYIIQSLTASACTSCLLVAWAFGSRPPQYSTYLKQSLNTFSSDMHLRSSQPLYRGACLNLIKTVFPIFLYAVDALARRKDKAVSET